MRRRFGPTLIELLVVIAVIAITAATLFPVLARVRSSARTTTCQEHLHQIYAAIKLYQLDNDFVPPITHWWTGWEDEELNRFRPNLVLAPYAPDRRIFACPAYKSWYDASFPDDPPWMAEKRREVGILVAVNWNSNGYYNGMFPDPWFDNVNRYHTPVKRFDDLLRPDLYTVLLCWTTWAHVTYEDKNGGKGVLMGTNVVKADGHVKLIQWADDVSDPNLWMQYRIEYWFGGMPDGTAFPKGMY